MTSPSSVPASGVPAPPPPELPADPVEPPHDGARPGRRRWYRRPAVAVGGVALLLAAAVLGTYFATRSHGSSPAAAVSVTTRDVTVSTGNLQQTVAASGTIQPAQESVLGFSVAGTVKSVDVAAGQKVTAGQVLATLDSTALADDLAAAQATLTADGDRLAADQAASASASQLASDQATVSAASAQVDSARTALSDATLTAPFTGTVAAVDLSAGQVVSGGGSSAPATGSGTGAGSGTRNSAAGALASALGVSSASTSSASSTTGITLVSTGAWSVSTSVDDTEVGRIKVGDQAVITPTGATTPVYGLVSSVGLIATSTSGVASFPVTVSVTGSPAGLYAGSSASVSIIVEQVDGVVEVPTAAISYTGGRPTVARVVNGSTVTTPVTTGITEAGETQIVAGLHAGDVVSERVVRFSVAGGTGRNLFGGGATVRRGAGGGLGGGGFGGGRFGGGAG